MGTPLHPQQGLPRREQIRAAATELFAEKGFRGVTLEEIGAACGISGPGVYKHFESKESLLRDLLVGISQHLLDGARCIALQTSDAEARLDQLIAFHANFAILNPALIRIQDRDLHSLGEASTLVRRLQRAYVEEWADALRGVSPHLSKSHARLHVQGIFGLLNSTPYLTRLSAPGTVRQVLLTMARGALGLSSK